MDERSATPWPARLWLVRHGESAGNVARDRAHASGAERIELPCRDVDMPLSLLGERQADALGAWFAGQPAADRPQVLLASPYRRAVDTAARLRAAGGAPDAGPVKLDERLREKEFGILDGLTLAGVAKVYPEQAELRRRLGKFYHRPPGGESWCDVVFRLRSVLARIALTHQGARVMIVAHQVVVLCLRYVLEDLTEEEVLAIDRAGDVANASVTEYALDPATDRLVLRRYNDVAPLSAVTVTAEPDPTPEPAEEPAR